MGVGGSDDVCDKDRGKLMATPPVMKIVPPYTPELLHEVQVRIRVFLENRKSPRVLELGSGWSTIWFAHMAQVLSLEHSEDWYREVARAYEEEVGFVPNLILTEPCNFPRIMQQMRREYYDLIYVDCIDEVRGACTFASIPLLRQGGWLVLDDTHWDLWRQILLNLRNYGFRDEVYSGTHLRKDGQTHFHHTTILTK